MLFFNNINLSKNKYYNLENIFVCGRL